MDEWRSGGVEKLMRGEAEEQISGGLKEWRNRGADWWRSGGMEEWTSGGVEKLMRGEAEEWKSR